MVSKTMYFLITIRLHIEAVIFPLLPKKMFILLLEYLVKKTSMITVKSQELKLNVYTLNPTKRYQNSG